MYNPALALLLTIGFFSQETSGHAQDFKTNEFISAVSNHSVESTTREEVDTFYPHNALSRCDFTGKMIPTFSEDSTLISALYDVMQGDGDIRFLTQEEFRQALLKQSGSLNSAEFQENVDEVMKQVHDINIRPYEFTEGPSMYDPDSYRAMSWAEDLDTDLDGQVSQEEISRWMRETLDADGNAVLERCEFVDAMRWYRQHPVTAAKVYDVIFKSRDLQWADVDSKFLAILISRKDTTNITTEEFARFFTYENEIASGVIVLEDGRPTSIDGNGATTGFSPLAPVLCLLAVLLSLLVMVHDLGDSL